MQTLPKLSEGDSQGVRWYRDDTLNELARVNGGRLFGESTMLVMLANGGLREYWTLPTPPLSDVSSPRGGPMGRRNLLPDDPSSPIALLLERLEWVDGDYDSGGAYWGAKSPVRTVTRPEWQDRFCDSHAGEGRPDWIWRAVGESIIGDDAEVFVRATDADSAKVAILDLLPGATFTLSGAVDLETFLAAYVECALWSSNDNADESGGEPLDANYSSDDIAPATLASMRSDCEAFIAANQADLVACGLSAARAGHNYWLNRNGHGAGFWDEVSGGHPLRDTFNRLSAASKADGTVDLYLGDDGKIYA